MNRTTAKGPRGASRPEPTSEETRFEIARRHIIQLRKLEGALSDAVEAKEAWLFKDAHGNYRYDERLRRMRPARRAKTPDERAEIKALDAAIVNARADILLHTNDGAKI